MKTNRTNLIKITDHVPVVLLNYGAKSEFITAAQTFSLLQLSKCGLELTIATH